MSVYEVEVTAYLNATYTVSVEADSEEEALDSAEHEVYGVIDPDDIQIHATTAREL